MGGKFCFWFITFSSTLAEGGRKGIRWGKVGNCHPATSSRVKVSIIIIIIIILMSGVEDDDDSHSAGGVQRVP